MGGASSGRVSALKVDAAGVPQAEVSNGDAGVQGLGKGGRTRGQRIQVSKVGQDRGVRAGGWHLAAGYPSSRQMLQACDRQR